MKKTIGLLITAAGMMALSVTANAFDTGPCKACHAVDQDKIGPAWKTVADTYGSADALASAFKSGFSVSDRKLASSSDKWKSKAMLMTPQFNNLIKGHEDEAAKALFAAVEAGKI